MFFFTANFPSSPNLEKKLALTVASLQRFFHWRTERTFGMAFKHPRSVFKRVDYWLLSHSLSLCSDYYLIICTSTFLGVTKVPS